MSLWIPVTLAAAFFQTLRFMLQKILAQDALSASGATLARFFYSAPIVVFLVGMFFLVSGCEFPELSRAFWAYGALGGASQIFGTVLVVMLFKARNFAVGITLKKTEVIQNVLFGLIILGEGVTRAGFLFICIGLVGVLLLSDPPDGRGAIWSRVWNPTALLGLASGAMFGISGVAYRGASLELALDEPMLRAGITLAAVTSMQLVAMMIWLRLFEKGQITRVWAARRTAGWVGLTSMAGSFCWFTAFTLQTAAYVNAVGQVELIFSLVASVVFFREKVSMREFLGVFVLGLSVIGLVLVIPT